MSKSNSAVAICAVLLLSAGASTAHAADLVVGGFGASPWVTTGNLSASTLGSGVGVIAFTNTFAGTLSQGFTTADAGLFDYAFDVGRGESACSCNDVQITFEARIDGTLLSNAIPAFDPSGGGNPLSTTPLSHYAGSLMLGAGAHELSFAFGRGPSGFGRGVYFVIDGVQGASAAPPALPGAGAVPEPASWAMMIVGFGLAGGVLRWRGAVRLTA